MKNFRKNEIGSVITILIMIITMTSCRNDVNPNTNTNNPTDVINIVNNGI